MGLESTCFGPFHVLADAVYTACVHGVLSECAFFQQILELAAVERIVECGREARPHLRLLAVPYRLYQEFTQGASLEMELAEYVEHLTAQGLARLLQLVEELSIYVALAGVVGHEVPQVTHFCLTDAVNPPEPLLQTVGIPGQVVVHHQVRALQVDAFAGGIGRQQYLHFWVVPKCLLRLESILAAHAAMDRYRGIGTAEQRRDAFLQVAQRVPMLGEQDQFLLRRRRLAAGSPRRRRGCPAPQPDRRARGQ